MNITFLIGNGFDLRMGMKTRFADMYEEYIESDSESEAIINFKEMLRRDAPVYKTWGDFEMAMAQRAKDFSDEDSFIECLRDFKLHMAAHLRKEQTEFASRLSLSKGLRNICAQEVSDSIHRFYNGLRPNVVNKFIELGAQEHPTFNFISFNYTNVFDSLLSPFLGTAIHIHGTLDADVVLGADNMGQITDVPYITGRRFNRAFIKPEFNRSYDIVRVERAETLIEKSDIICVYGMSLGKSDLSWTNKLKEWLLSYKDNHLVYFTYDERKFNKLNWDAIMDEEEDRVATLLGKICNSGEEMDKIFNQVHIPVGYDIFGVDEIINTELQKIKDEFLKKERLRKQLENRPQEIGIIGAK